jgi:type II secretory pathway pseudopilin PulG
MIAPAAADSTQAATAQAAQQQARRQRRQQQEGAQQQRALGRKGGLQLRQTTDDDPPTVFIGDLDDYVLPFWQPTEGVVCSGAPACRAVDAAVLAWHDDERVGDCNSEAWFWWDCIK